MKMPEYVKIGGVCYSTEITDQFYEGKNNVDGEIVFGEQVIKLSPNLKGDKLFITLIHEILHGVAYFLGNRELNDDEEKIDQIAQIVFMLIQDNPEMLNGDYVLGIFKNATDEQKATDVITIPRVRFEEMLKILNLNKSIIANYQRVGNDKLKEIMEKYHSGQVECLDTLGLPFEVDESGAYVIK